MPRLALALTLLATTATATAQWTLQDSHSTASFRGVHNVGNGVVWVSGTEGTVLHTTDNGKTWQHCPTPPNAEKLDFRGIKAIDADTAIVMSSGPGDASRLYGTTDTCKTWKLLATNPDKEGFWDTLAFDDDDAMIFVLGDPVDGNFRLFSAPIDEDTLKLDHFAANWNSHPLKAAKGQAAFAASNSLFAFTVGEGMFSFITGGAVSEIIHEEHGLDQKKGLFSEWSRSPLPFSKCEACGAFAMAARDYDPRTETKTVVVVGGDYTHPNENISTAAVSTDWGYHFKLSSTQPHGYRSAVAYSPTTKTWITVGPNGTDISTDDGRNWQALTPGPQDQPDADKNWNALSLPFVVGPKGRIGILREAALAQMK